MEPSLFHSFSHSLQISQPSPHYSFLSPLSSKSFPSKMMGLSRFLALLLVMSLLSLSFTYGFGKALTETVYRHHYPANKAETTEENSRKLRVMAQVMDYGDPEANTNPKYGNLFSPPTPSVVPPSPS